MFPSFTKILLKIRCMINIKNTIDLDEDIIEKPYSVSASYAKIRCMINNYRSEIRTCAISVPTVYDFLTNFVPIFHTVHLVELSRSKASEPSSSVGLTTSSLSLGVLSKQRYPMRCCYEFKIHLLFLRIFYQHFANFSWHLPIWIYFSTFSINIKTAISKKDLNLKDKFVSLKLVVNNVRSWYNFK